MTNRSSSLDPSKLEYINKHHLLRESSTPEGLEALAQRVLRDSGLTEQFPGNEFVNQDIVREAIRMLEARFTNIQDLGKLVPYLFTEPDWNHEEATRMMNGITLDQKGCSLFHLSIWKSC